MTTPYAMLSPEDVDRAGASEIGLRAAAMAEKFVAKVAERESKIRAAVAQGQ